MTDPAMSPAQKVLAAFKDRHELCGPFDDDWVEQCLAAAFRVAADEVVPDEGHVLPIHHPSAEWFRFDERKKARAALLAIAAEPENLQS
jgi:hypothetical protein